MYIVKILRWSAIYKPTVRYVAFTVYQLCRRQMLMKTFCMLKLHATDTQT